MASSFDPRELEIRGYYGNVGSYFGSPFPPAPIFDTPVTPKENLIGLLEHRRCEWIPNGMNDINWICPDMVPDVYAIGFEGGIDSFGVEWVPTRPDLGLPSMVKPGHPKLDDIADWEEILVWPDVDSWGWEEAGRAYVEGSPKERMSMGVVNTGFFERLISLLDFEGAAIALVDDPESVCSFFDRLVEFNIDVARHYRDYCNTDMIVIFDDWGSQKSTFFSRETLHQTILPFYKRMCSAIHDMGMYVMTHCDGHVEGFVPEMIEQGSDMWNLQPSANPNLDRTVEEYGDRLLFDMSIEIDSQMDIEEYRGVASQIYAKGENRTLNLVDEMFCASDERAKVNYELSRKAASGELEG